MKAIFIALIVILVGGAIFLNFQKTEDKIILKEQPIDYKASFEIITHGTFRVFTAAMYHNLSKDVFIQADNPNIVHVKRSGITWDDFFKTLPLKLTSDCLTTGTGETFCNDQGGTLKFFLNGKKDKDLLQKTIKDGDRALITFGK